MSFEQVLKNFKFNKKSKTPLYYQVYSYLKDIIENNNIPPDTLFKSEGELCNLMSVSRITIRTALRELEEEGYISRRAGKGTFISKKPNKTQLILKKPFSIFEQSRLAGFKANSKILKNEIIIPSNRIQKEMNLGDGIKVLLIERFTFLNEEPMVLQRVYLPNNIFKKISNEILENTSYSKIVSEIFNAKILDRQMIIEADVPDNKLSKLMEIKNDEKKVILLMTAHWNIEYMEEKAVIFHETFFHRTKGRILIEY